ncbi:MAG: hypothetical protein ACRC62_16605 [Microcoleus sp.]
MMQKPTSDNNITLNRDTVRQAQIKINSYKMRHQQAPAKNRIAALDALSISYQQSGENKQQ